MKKITLKFSALTQLIDFEKETRSYGRHWRDYNHLTITGYFEEAEIEFAMAGYNATVEEYNE